MAKNQRGHGKRVRVTATAARTSGSLIIESGFHGVAVNDIASGAVGDLDIEQVEHEVDELAGATRGQIVYATAASALTLTATGNRAVAKVTRIAGDEGVPTGKMWVLVLPQPAA